MAEKYCTKCGYENLEERGACLMCYNYLDAAGTGVTCPNCGADNSKEAAFCTACGTQLSSEVFSAPPIALLAAAEAIWQSAGGEVGEYDDAEEDEYNPDEMSDEERAAFAQFQQQQTTAQSGPVSPPIDDEEFQPIMAATIDDESDATIAMSGVAAALADDEEDFSATADLSMDDDLSLDDDIGDADEIASEKVPAPPAFAATQDIAVDEDAEITADDLAMPVPGDLPDFTGSIADPLFEEDEDEAKQDKAPAKETKATEASDNDVAEDLGDWNLAFGEEEG